MAKHLQILVIIVFLAGSLSALTLRSREVESNEEAEEINEGELNSVEDKLSTAFGAAQQEGMLSSMQAGQQQQ